MRPVALLTDYGAGSEHVGALHAVIARDAPGADRIDLAHDLPPGDVRHGALVLSRLAPLLPEGAVVLAVVDPGVGTVRRAAAAWVGGDRVLVGPDNGLLGLAAARLGATRARALATPPGASATFHGRDLFAPAAAALARGAAPAGDPLDPSTLVRPDLPAAEVRPGRLDALVAGADGFGNLELLAGAADLRVAGFARGAALAVGVRDGAGHPATLARTFGDVPPGALLVYLDSADAVAIARRDGDAARALGLAPGDHAVLTRRQG